MRFAGYERDLANTSSAADDLDYMHARFCNPQLGRFLRVDPKRRHEAMKSPQRWNRYAYAIGSPLRFVDPDGEDIVVATTLQNKVATAYAGSATFRALYDNLNKDHGILVKIRLGQMIRAGTKAETHVERKKFIITNSGTVGQATVTLTTIPPGQGGDDIGHELQHSVELRSNADITKAAGAFQSGSGVEGDIETQAAIEAGRTVAKEMKDPSGNIALTKEMRAEIFEASNAHPGCAEGKKDACPEPK